MPGPKKTSTPPSRNTVAVAGAPGPNGIAIQLKGNNLPTSAAMTSAASKGLITAVISNTHTYEDIVDGVAEYYSNAIPNNDYGRQLIKLENIDHNITTWEGKYGPVTQPVVPRAILGLKDEDKRRQVLLNLRNQIAPETQLVKTQGHQAANTAHQQDRTILNQYVNEALTTNDRRLKNSAEWILTAHKTLLFAVTPTGDSFARLTKAGKDPAVAEAFFPEGMGGPGDITGAALSYNQNNLTDNTNVNIRDNGKVLGGWNKPGFVAITSPALKPKAEIWETLRHEVQHDADKNAERDAQSGIRGATEAVDANQITYQDIDDINAGGATALNAAQRLRLLHGGNLVTNMQNAKDQLLPIVGAEIKLTKYKTEYRAYSYQEGDTPGKYAALDNTVQNQVHDGHNFSARQLAIFKHIYDNYDHTKNGWDDNRVLNNGQTFRQAVVAYWNPDTEGANQFNSARVDDFYRALDPLGTKAARTSGEVKYNLDAAPVNATGKETDAANPGVLHLIAMANALHKEDAQYIQASPFYTSKLNNHLDDPAKQAVINAVTQKANS